MTLSQHHRCQSQVKRIFTTESWQHLPQFECLQIRYWAAHDKEAAAHRVQVTSQEYSARLENLLPDTQYFVEVRACNSAGCGPPSDMIETFTKKARESTFAFRLIKNYQSKILQHKLQRSRIYDRTWRTLFLFTYLKLVSNILTKEMD